MRFGIPCQGSKDRIAEWVVEQLPASHTRADLFAGGCAVTHAALLSIVNQIAKLTNHSRLAVARKLTELIRSTHGVMRIKS